VSAALRELRERGYLRRGEGPGAPLRLALDAGGERWTLDGRPVHAGEALEALLRAEAATCPRCRGEGRRIPDTYPHEPGADCDCPICDGGVMPERVRCPACDGDGELYRPVWLAVRFEYHNAGDGSGHALLYPRLWHGAGAERLAVRVEGEDLVRCRWPVA
jgi:hypothetical protein